MKAQNFQHPSTVYYPHNPSKHYRNKNHYFLHSITPHLFSQQQSLPETHINSITCFQQCSKWTFSLTPTTPPSKHITFPNENITGKITQYIPQIYIQNYIGNCDLSNFFPIDIRNNQRFALDPNQPSIPLNIEFDINKNSSLRNIDSDYTNFIFEINLNASLHKSNSITKHNNVFKDRINFKVKGFDIVKAIQNKLYNVITHNNIQFNKSNDMHNYTINVFNNIQCSFGVGFSISNNSLQTYSKSLYRNIHSISSLQIKITSVKIQYTLPLIVFSLQNIKQQFTNLIYVPNNNIYSHYIKGKQNLMNNNNNSYSSFVQNKQLPMSPHFMNFCNWHSFMSCTTPIIYETDVLLLKDIMNSFIKPSLFGICCLFKIDNQTYTKANFFPSLGTVYLSFQASLSNNNNNNNSNDNIKSTNLDTSTLDNSSITSNSSIPDEKNNYNPNIKSHLFFKEQIQEIYNMKTYKEQLNTFYHNNSELDELTLGDISSESYFSLIWNYIKTPQNSLSAASIKSGITYVECENYSSIEVFYKFKRGGMCSNTGKYLDIIGIVEKDIKGRKINSLNDKFFDHFWFANKSIKAHKFNSYCYEKDMYNNKNNFFYYTELANELKFDS